MGPGGLRSWVGGGVIEELVILSVGALLCACIAPAPREHINKGSVNKIVTPRPGTKQRTPSA